MSQFNLGVPINHVRQHGQYQRVVLQSKFDIARLSVCELARQTLNSQSDNGYHDVGFQLSLLTQTFFRLCVHSHKRRCLNESSSAQKGVIVITTLVKRKRIVIMESCEDYKNIVTAKSNTVSANEGREECWQNKLIYLFYHSVHSQCLRLFLT